MRSVLLAAAVAFVAGASTGCGGPGADGPPSVGSLRARIEHGSAADRAAAARAVGGLGRDGAALVPDLARALGDADVGVRRAAAGALERQGQAAAAVASELVAAMGDADPDVRRSAARAVAALGPLAGAVVRALVGHLATDDPEVGDAAASAVVRSGPGAVPALLDLLRAARSGSTARAEAAFRRVASATDIHAGLEDPASAVRAAAAGAFAPGKPLSAASARVLARLLTDPDVRVQGLARTALTANPSVSTSVLAEQAASAQVEARLAAMDVLAAIGPPARDARGAVVAALSSADVATRCAAARAVAAIVGDQDGAGDVIVPFLVDAAPEARELALAVLPRCRGLSAPPLLALLESADPEVRARAEAVLLRSTPRDVSAFAAALGSHSVEVRRVAARMLGRAGRDAVGARTALELALGDEPAVAIEAARALGSMGRAGAKAQPALAAALTSADPGVRREVATALGALGDGAAADVLLSLLDDPVSEVRDAGTDALDQLGAGATAALLKAYPASRGDRRARVRRILLRAPEQAVPALAQALRDPDDEVRELAAKALERLGPTAADAVPALVGVLGDANPIVHRQAVISLSRVGPAAVSALCRLLRRGEPQLQERAAEALQGMRRAAAPAVPELVGLLRGEGTATELRLSVIRALGAIGPAAAPALPALVARLDEPGLREVVEAALRNIRGAE